MHQKFLLPLLYLFLLFYFTPAEARFYTVSSVPNPKESGTGYISDPGLYLSHSAKNKINTLLTKLERRTSDQVAVVVLSSIGSSVPKDFAHRLFNRWGIGVIGKNNGLLILMVIDQRRIEFETGYGMERVLTDEICKEIQSNYMVPRFKEENYDQGMLDGVIAVVDFLEGSGNHRSAPGVDTLVTDTAKTNAKVMEAAAPASDHTEHNKSITPFIIFGFLWILAAAMAHSQKIKNKSFEDLYEKASAAEKAKVTAVISKSAWFFFYMIVPLFLLGYFFKTSSNYAFPILYFYVLFLLIEKRIRAHTLYKKRVNEKDNYDKYQLYTQSHQNWFWAAIFFPFPFIFYMLNYLSEKVKIRSSPRVCAQCAAVLVKLNEQQEDQYLSESQLVEEQINSIDYDVWYCNNCSSTQVLSYKNKSSSYTECPSCQSRAYYLFSNETIESATYDSTGKGRRTYKCEFCDHTHSENYSIAQKVRSSSSSGRRGQRWSGGRSGGGGAGSNW